MNKRKYLLSFLLLLCVLSMSSYIFAQDGQGLSEKERIAALEASYAHLATRADLYALVSAAENRLMLLILGVGAISGINIIISIRRNSPGDTSTAEAANT